MRIGDGDEMLLIILKIIKQSNSWFLLVGYIKIKLCKINDFSYGLEVWHQCLAGFREIHSTPFSNTKSVFEDLNILCIILLNFFLFFA